jgi:hypothetical protein
LAKNIGITDEQFKKAWADTKGNFTQTAALLNCSRQTATERARALKLNIKPLAAGTTYERKVKSCSLPPKGAVRRYLITSAQNNTHVYDKFWYALLQLADFYDAEVMVGTFTYNQNHFGQLSVKQGTKKQYERELWYDPILANYVVNDPVDLAPGLRFCGEQNILPTAVDPLSGLETYAHRKSCIFPHAKVAMRSIATMQGEGAKLNYTTGTATLRNYIQKREGITAEHHHRYAALVVEVNHKGNWFVRQVGMSAKGGTLQDLDVVVHENGKVTQGNPIEAVTWGDLHSTWVDKGVQRMSHEMLDSLRPKFQFFHDVFEGVSFNRHYVKNAPLPHQFFARWKRGLHRVEEELKATMDVLASYDRKGVTGVIVDSNHDSWWLKSWLAKYDYRYDPANALLFLRMQSFVYGELDKGMEPKKVNLMKWVLQHYCPALFLALLPDESFKTCSDKIENGMHGHLGPNGSMGTPASLNKVGRRANTAHTHSAGIWNGLYVAGTSSKLEWDYAYGPSSWTHSHVVTYPNGMRTVVTMYNGNWRAVEE